ncbi:efflux RND transporter permease subunit [Xylanibacillus composti]|uniref:Multidrug transporter AcrB n=1 Tax=Xylanibacillus composti TaxID=1572762 RepID=A0A8J4H1E8_9BACL|nr:efflux RND transporter permease subunit [Xylanibacillus composti]GIQ67810.1 multidrug transporter AcrB [Xylanibacillus composti]
MMKMLLQRPLAVFLVAVMVLVSGVVSAFMLPIKLQPNVSAPFLLVSANVEQDTDLDTMEKEITIPLETLVKGHSIVNNVQATTTTKHVNLQIIMKDSATDDEIGKLREELNQRLNAVPLDLSGSDVRQFSTSDNVIMVIAVTSDDPAQDKVRSELKDRLVPALREVNGVSKIEHTLDQYEESFKFELKPDQIKSLQHASQLVDELRGSFASPLLGTLEYDGSQYRVRSEASITSMDELMQHRFQSGERLADVADVEIDMIANHRYTMMNGEPYYEINVFATDSASEVKVSQKVNEVLNRMQADQQTRWEYLYAWDASAFIGTAISELVVNIMFGAGLASIILLLVFRNLRTMLIVGFSMPICICATLIAMSVAGYSLNIITLMGIGLGTGMIVDACIVVIENIYRKLQEGGSRLDAVVQGTKEVFAPVLASILTTIAVFLPISFIDGMIGVFMKQLALTITVSLAASLVVALTVIPILANKWMKLSEKAEKKDSRILVFYEKLLHYVLRRRWRTLLGFVLALVVALYSLIAFVPKGFIPNVTDRSLFINVEVDENIDYETNLLMMDATAEAMLPIDGVKEVLYWGNDENTSSGAFIVLFEDRADMEQTDDEMTAEIKATIDRMIPYSFLSIGAGQGDTSGQMSIALSASTMQDLVRHVPAVQDEIELIPGVTGTEASLTEGSKEWVIHFSKEQLAYYGISRQEVEQYTSLILNGVPEIDVSMDGKDTTASIVFPAIYRQSSDGLAQLPIRSDLNLTIEDVARLEQVDAEASRVRRDGEYELILSIYFDSEQRNAVISQVTNFVSAYQGELRASLSGTQQQQQEGFEKLLIAVAVSFAAVFLILTIQFNRMRLPFLIMFSLPFAMIGVALGFLLTGRTFDLVAMIGIVMLVGIVVNNAIVLIDFINKHRAEYDDVITAVVEGAKLRLRPIFTTTLTTVGGLIPMFIGGSEASEFQTPLATAVIFGLTFSTFVSLVLVPVLYYFFEGRADRKKDKAERKLQKQLKKQEKLQQKQQPVIETV